MPFIEYANALLIVGGAIHALLKFYIAVRKRQPHNEKSRPA